MTSLESCPSCGTSLKLFTPRDGARHINICLDSCGGLRDPSASAPVGSCGVCGRNLDVLTAAARAEHAIACGKAQRRAPRSRPRRTRYTAPVDGNAGAHRAPDKKLRTVLSALGLSRYAARFEREEIDLDALRLLSDDDLTALRLPEVARRRIAEAQQSVEILRLMAGDSALESPSSDIEAPPTQQFPETRLPGTRAIVLDAESEDEALDYLYSQRLSTPVNSQPLSQNVGKSERGSASQEVFAEAVSVRPPPSTKPTRRGQVPEPSKKNSKTKARVRTSRKSERKRGTKPGTQTSRKSASIGDDDDDDFAMPSRNAQVKVDDVRPSQKCWKAGKKLRYGLLRNCVVTAPPSCVDDDNYVVVMDNPTVVPSSSSLPDTKAGFLEPCNQKQLNVVKDIVDERLPAACSQMDNDCGEIVIESLNSCGPPVSPAPLSLVAQEQNENDGDHLQNDRTMNATEIPKSPIVSRTNSAVLTINYELNNPAVLSDKKCNVTDGDGNSDSDSISVNSQDPVSQNSVEHVDEADSHDDDASKLNDSVTAEEMNASVCKICKQTSDMLPDTLLALEQWRKQSNEIEVQRHKRKMDDIENEYRRIKRRLEQKKAQQSNDELTEPFAILINQEPIYNVKEPAHECISAIPKAQQPGEHAGKEVLCEIVENSPSPPQLSPECEHNENGEMREIVATTPSIHRQLQPIDLTLDDTPAEKGSDNSGKLSTVTKSTHPISAGVWRTQILEDSQSISSSSSDDDDFATSFADRVVSRLAKTEGVCKSVSTSLPCNAKRDKPKSSSAGTKHIDLKGKDQEICKTVDSTDVNESESEAEELMDLTQREYQPNVVHALADLNSRESVTVTASPGADSGEMGNTRQAKRAHKKSQSRLRKPKKCTHADLREAIRADPKLLDDVLLSKCVEIDRVMASVKSYGLKVSQKALEDFMHSEGVGFKASTGANTKSSTQQYFVSLATAEMIL